MRDWGERDARWAGIRSETCTITTADGDRTEVHLLRAGPDDDSGGDPTLLVHGLGGSATNWLDVMGPLAADGPVVAVDLPGFGRTEPPTARAGRIDAQGHFLDRFLRELGWGRTVVHGNSMGGLLAVLLAARSPHRVQRLVLTAPALPAPRRPDAISPAALARFAPFVSWRLGHLVLERVYGQSSPEEVRQDTMRLVMGEVEDVRPAMRQVQIENVELARQVDWRLPSFARAASDLAHTLARARSVQQAIDAVVAPTLVVWGDQDKLVSRAAMDETMARRPDWRRVDMPGVGHAPMLEAPDGWLDAVRTAGFSGQ